MSQISQSQELICALNYIALRTRPDISFAVGFVARYQDQPNITICKAIRHILKYLYSNKDLFLCLSGDKNSLVGFSDTDWAGDPATKRSITDFIFYLGNSSIHGNQKSNKQWLYQQRKQNTLHCQQQLKKP